MTRHRVSTTTKSILALIATVASGAAAAQNPYGAAVQNLLGAL